MIRRISGLSAGGARTWLGASASLLAFASAALALEPTPPQPSDEPPAVSAQPQLAAPRIIVKYIDSAPQQLDSPNAADDAADALSDLAGIQIEHVRPMSGNAHVVEVLLPENMPFDDVQANVEAIAAIIADSPIVEYAEPDEFNFIQQAANDTRFGEQWHYTTPQTGVNLAAGWANAHGTDVVVAVIDTGFRPHPDLQGNLLPGFDFISHLQVANDGDLRDADASDPGDWITAADTWCGAPARDSSWHGTHVAGTVAAVTDNNQGVAGVGRGAGIVPIRVLGKCGGLTSDIIDGMRWAAGLAVPDVPTNANPAKVLNLSLGGSGSCSAAYQDAIDDVVAQGATVVVAAGNSNSDAANFRPASCDGVVTVASTNRAGARSYYSNFGSTVEIAAPGGETFASAADGVLSTWNTGTTTPGSDDYTFYQGTSMAAPHVAGVVALLYEARPSVTPAEVANMLQSTAQPFPSVSSNQCSTANCGAGIVDAGKLTTPDDDQEPITTGWMKLLLGN